MGRVRRGLLIVCAALLLAPGGGASSVPLPTRLANALAVPGNSTTASGAVVVDLQTGQLLFARHPDLPLAPASNEKLTVSFTALRELGTTYRFRTEVFGRGHQEDGVWHGDVFLKGFGDPTLTSLQLERLAVLDRSEVEQLRLAGHAGSVALQPMESKPAGWGERYGAVFAEGALTSYEDEPLQLGTGAVGGIDRDDEAVAC